MGSWLDDEVLTISSIFMDEVEFLNDEKGNVRSLATTIFPSTAGDVKTQYLKLGLKINFPNTVNLTGYKLKLLIFEITFSRTLIRK